MRDSLVILKVIAEECEVNNGRVLPKDVFRAVENTGIKSFTVRQMFAECKYDGLLHFDGKYYYWNENHWLNYAGIDICRNMQNS